jgi:hypothetical protein
VKDKKEECPGMLIAEWKRLSKIAARAREAADKAYARAKLFSKLPKNLRPATPEDLVVGAILWYRDSLVDTDDNGEEFEYVRWDFVEAYPEPDPTSGWYSSDGCFYKLDDDTFVEVREKFFQL